MASPTCDVAAIGPTNWPRGITWMWAHGNRTQIWRRSWHNQRGSQGSQPAHVDRACAPEGAGRASYSLRYWQHVPSVGLWHWVECRSERTGRLRRLRNESTEQEFFAVSVRAVEPSSAKKSVDPPGRKKQSRVSNSAFFDRGLADGGRDIGRSDADRRDSRDARTSY